MQTLDRRKIIAFLALIAFFSIFFYGLGSILTPFVTAALLAYLGDPLVDRLERLKIGRSLSVATVFLFLSLIILLLVLFFGPLLGDQIQQFIKKLPAWIDRFESFLIPRLREWGFFSNDQFNQEAIKDAMSEYWKEGGNLALNTLKKLGSSGAALFTFLTNLILIPVLSFYLLRDWDLLVEKIRNLLPRASESTVVGLAQECNEVLSSFLRGQLVVMLCLAVVYSIGLSLIGLDLAILIGTVAGMANIIPYMGFAVGIISALVAAWMQFYELMPLVFVVLVFSGGQLLEGMYLTPNLVGDKIGLHPVAVIFSLMAGAKLGGFVGLLLALPVAAVLMVVIRYFIEQYKNSYLYYDGARSPEAEMASGATATEHEQTSTEHAVVDQPTAADDASASPNARDTERT